MKKISIALIVIILVFFSSVILHEFGHAVTAEILGYDVHTVYMFPGYQLYPDFGATFLGEWPTGRVAYTEVSSGIVFEATPSNVQLAIQMSDGRLAWIKLMGSGFTWLISVICLITIRFIKPWSIFFYFLLVGSLFYYDIVFYVIFPYYLDLPHIIFWGGYASEPVDAFYQLGLNKTFTAGLIVLVGLLQTIYLVRLIYNCGPSKQDIIESKNLKI